MIQKVDMEKREGKRGRREAKGKWEGGGYDDGKGKMRKEKKK